MYLISLSVKVTISPASYSRMDMSHTFSLLWTETPTLCFSVGLIPMHLEIDGEASHWFQGPLNKSEQAKETYLMRSCSSFHQERQVVLESGVCFWQIVSTLQQCLFFYVSIDLFVPCWEWSGHYLMANSNPMVFHCFYIGWSTGSWAQLILCPHRACLQQAVDLSFVLKSFSWVYRDKKIHLCGILSQEIKIIALVQWWQIVTEFN